MKHETPGAPHSGRPLVSVVVPAYNQGPFLAQAVQSLLDQTYPHWELLIVDDGSTDDTAQVADGFADPRIRLISQANRGLPGARNTGIRAARGEYLAFLDADDAFHPQILAAHVAHLQAHPEIGLSYAGRIEVDGDLQPTWFLRAPARVELSDLVLGFPFTINDLLMRRSWAERIGGFDESFRLHSEDRDFYLRLALDGCRFGLLNRFAAYRRVHPSRVFSSIPERIQVMERALETAFGDPRCPPEVLALRNAAYGRVYLTWALQELSQQETACGQEHLLQAASLDPAIFAGQAENFLQAVVWFSVRQGGDPLEVLDHIFSGLPEGFAPLREHKSWAAGRGFLYRGLRANMWGDDAGAARYFRQASEHGARLDEPFLQVILDQLAGCAVAYGGAAMQAKFKSLAPHLKRVGQYRDLRWLESNLALHQAFRSYAAGDYRRAPGHALRAIWHDPAHLRNRGVLSILARSLRKRIEM